MKPKKSTDDAAGTDASRQRFVVGFTVLEAKELSRDGVAVDPLCLVRALGREYKTELKRGKLKHVKFNESYIWSDIHLTEEEFNMAFIDFELQAANIWTRNDVIGTARVQLAMVRRRPNHTTAQKWLQLSSSAATSAQLKVTVFCYGQGEDPPRPEDLENDQEELNKHLEGLGNALVGDGMGKKLEDMQAYYLFVQVHRAENLGGGEQNFNPFVSVEFNGHKVDSPPARDAHTLMFDESFRMPVVLPVMADSVLIRVWDRRGKLRSDAIIVQGRLSFSLLRMHALQPKWFNFYGFSSKEVGDVGSLTSQGEVAEENFFMGRLLISGRVQKAPDAANLPKAGLVKGQVVEEPPASATTFALDVMEISGCPGGEVYVEMSIGVKSKSSKPVPRSDLLEEPDLTTAGRFRYTPGEGRVSPLLVVLPTDPSNQLDVILSIYSKLQDGVLQKVTRVGFVRIKVAKIKEWRGETAPPFWVACRPMAHLPSSIEPGSVLISLAKSNGPIHSRGVPNVRPLQFEVRCYIFMARDIVPPTSEVPNPFVQISCAGRWAKTSTVQSTIAPSWGALLKVPIELQCSLETQKVQPEPIQIVVYDDIKDALQDLTVDTAQANLDKLGAMGQQAFSGLQDHIGNLTGDVHAKKRIGAVVNGQRVIGRTQVTLRHILRPNDKEQFMPRWLRLKGGFASQTAVGDILVGFEMMKKKYAARIPVQPVVPQCRACTLSVSILGLRDLQPINNRPVQNPKLQVLVPSLTGKKASVHTIEWTPKPQTKMGPDDLNRRWICNGKSGFDFFSVIHLDCTLPRFPVWEPNVRFCLLDGDNTDSFLAEGRVSLAEHIPWIKAAKGKKAVEAQEDYNDKSDDKDDGIQVSDAEDEGQASYITIEVPEGTLGVGFKASDTKSFPPIVSAVASEQKAHMKSVRRGDWLVAVREPGKQEKPVAAWSPAQAAQWVAEWDKKEEARPITMRFRRTDRAEVFVRLMKGQPSGLEMVADANAVPPKISKDVSAEKAWKRQGIGPGWRIVDINGFDTKSLNSKDPQFNTRLASRPAIITCRPHGVGVGLSEMNNMQMSKPVMLSGVPSIVHREFLHKLKHKDGCMAFSTVPRPSLILPQVNDTKQLNMYISRGAVMDVCGIVRHVIKGSEDTDETRTRPNVPGKLEDNMESCIFTSVPLKNGPLAVGSLKVSYRIICPADKEWVSKVKDPASLDRILFVEQLFRKNYKVDQPVQFRVRTYVIRGLNVSGAKFGYGNPFLFFKYGQDMVSLEGYRQLNSVEPRFFKTEERDVNLPEQALFEVGLYDWQESGSHEMIGKSIIDLEDRWHTPTFKAYMKQNKVPIEYRPVNQEMETGGSICKGSLEMWMEILDSAAASEVPASALVQPPAVEVEIRAVAYTVRNLSLRLCVDEETGDERENVTMRVRCSLDCKAYLGNQLREQETDLHHNSDGNGEFNWRFVFSRVAVTQGVPLDCFLQFSIWEHFDMAAPMMLCENLVEMKNYCKKVAQHSEELQMEAELPLANSQLTNILTKEMNLEDEDEEEYGTDGDNGQGEQAPLKPDGTDNKREIPPAALVKVMVQVIPQTQASAVDMLVGLGRSEPNRNPVLSFPKTGRNWEDILPGTAKVIHEVITSVSTFKRRCTMVTFMVSVLAVIGVLHYVKNPKTGCPYIQKSCKSESSCPACACCHHRDKDAAIFCYYAWMNGEQACAAKTFWDICNYQGSSCALPDPGGCDPCAEAGSQACALPPTTATGQNFCAGTRRLLANASWPERGSA